jgi:putative membrane protein
MKTYLNSRLLPFCAGALLIAGSALAQTTSRPGDPNHPRNPGAHDAATQTTIHGNTNLKSDAPRADRRFYKKAAQLGDKQVALSRIAADRAVNPQVQAFASEMVRAHTAAHTELAALQHQKDHRRDDGDWAIEQRETTKKWNDKKADDFDEDYIEAMIDTHEDAVDLFEKGIKSKNSGIVAYSAKLLPSMKTHLAQAENLEQLVD